MLATAAAVADDPDYDFGGEFDAGLDLVLDGIDRWRDGSDSARGLPRERTDGLGVGGADLEEPEPDPRGR